MCYPSGVNLAFVTSWNYLQVSRCFPVSLFMFVRQILGLTANAVGTFHFDASISPAPWHGHAAMPPCPFKHQTERRRSYQRRAL